MATGQIAGCNLPFREPLRWSLYKAAREFDIGEPHLKKRLLDCAEFPGKDECYGTAQLIHALYGSIHVERLRKLTAEADNVELENAITRGEYLQRSELARGLTQLIDGLLQIVNNSSLSREDKDDFLNNVASLPVVLRDVAGRQTKLRTKDRNGDHPPKAKEKPALTPEDLGI